MEQDHGGLDPRNREKRMGDAHRVYAQHRKRAKKSREIVYVGFKLIAIRVINNTNDTVE